MTDLYNAVYEADEANNVSEATAVEVLTPDLTPTAPTAPPLVVTQHQEEVSWTVENQGNGEAKGGWYDQLYLSEDDVLDGGDSVLDSFYRSQALESGESYSPVRTVTIPNVPAGTYYLILKTDLNNNLYEEDETNNMSSGEVYVSNMEAFRIVTIGFPASGRLRLDFTNDAGQMYGLDRRDSMDEGDWAAEEFFLTETGIEPYSEVLGTGEILSIYVESIASRSFYRIVRQ